MTTEKDIVATYVATGSLKATAKQIGLSEATVRKVLITSGEYTSPRADEINQMVDAGLSIKEVAGRLSCTVAAVQAFLPYSRGSYMIGEKTENAKHIADWRKKQKD
jgi:hypothetical protein